MSHSLFRWHWSQERLQTSFEIFQLGLPGWPHSGFL